MHFTNQGALRRGHAQQTPFIGQRAPPALAAHRHPNTTAAALALAPGERARVQQPVPLLGRLGAAQILAGRPPRGGPALGTSVNHQRSYPARRSGNSTRSPRPVTTEAEIDAGCWRFCCEPEHPTAEAYERRQLRVTAIPDARRGRAPQKSVVPSAKICLRGGSLDEASIQPANSKPVILRIPFALR